MLSIKARVKPGEGVRCDRRGRRSDRSVTIIAGEDTLSLKSTELFCCYNTLNSNNSTLHSEDMESSIFMSNVPYINLNVEHSNHLNVGNGPFPQDCGHQHRKSPKVFMCIFFKCMYIYNSILCIKLPLHQITKNSLC